jgi:regulator of replication initiation timing
MGVIETASDLAKLAQKLGNIEVYEKVISLQSQVMELIGANMSLREEMQPLKEELRKLNDKTEITKSLKYRNNNYYTVVDGNEDGPFCTVCWDVDQKLVRMFGYHANIGGTRYRCDYCSRARSS